jgi:hypothetical protein
MQGNVGDNPAMTSAAEKDDVRGGCHCPLPMNFGMVALP